MEDLTILYYSANIISNEFAEKVRNHLLSVVGDTPIISITRKPIDFGKNLCIGEVQPSVWYIYKQVLIGAMEAKTKYVACAEDDTLYSESHFNTRPPDDTFIYNEGHYDLWKDHFIQRNRKNMSTCIATRDLMVDTLTKRFEKYPKFLDSLKRETKGFAEPGRYEWYLKLPPVKIGGFSSEVPPIVFWHRDSLGGVRKLGSKDVVFTELPFWGKAIDLWNNYYTRL
jgi:hypothetical protein